MGYFHREDIPRCRGATGLQALLVEQRQHGGACQAVQAFSDPNLRLHVRLQKTQGLVEILGCLVVPQQEVARELVQGQPQEIPLGRGLCQTRLQKQEVSLCGLVQHVAPRSQGRDPIAKRRLRTLRVLEGHAGCPQAAQPVRRRHPRVVLDHDGHRQRTPRRPQRVQALAHHRLVVRVDVDLQNQGRRAANVHVLLLCRLRRLVQHPPSRIPWSHLRLHHREPSGLRAHKLQPAPRERQLFWPEVDAETVDDTLVVSDQRVRGVVGTEVSATDVHDADTPRQDASENPAHLQVAVPKAVAARLHALHRGEEALAPEHGVDAGAVVEACHIWICAVVELRRLDDGDLCQLCYHIAGAACLRHHPHTGNSITSSVDRPAGGGSHSVVLRWDCARHSVMMAWPPWYPCSW
mmetsp:Transcript_83209/g.239212  ORF Transcript_83209/g.239212 Transcript_83209/m.239212 type:complete len:407 (-) Transcript_83209:158-1378(-)